jgi:hypothetical protein
VPVQLIGSSIVPSSLVSGFRASPVPRVFRLCRSGNPGLPRGCILQHLRLRISQVAPGGALFSCAGDASSSCLATRILQRCRSLSGGLPRLSAFPASPFVFQPSRPGFRTFRPFRRWSFGSPRVSNPSALLLGDSSGCPASSLLQPRLAVFPPGCPGLKHLPVVPAMESRVTPRLASFGAAVSLSCGLPRRSALPASPPDVSAGLPRLPHPLALPTANLRVAPNLPALGVAALASPRLPLGPAQTAGSMMNPWPVSNFASPACAADESSRPIRSCTSLPDPGCCFNLIPSACLAAN